MSTPVESLLFVDCVEPYGRPQRRTLEVRAGEEFAIYMVAPSSDVKSGLRRTVIRRFDENPPAGSRLVMWLQTDGAGLTVVEVSRGILVEMIRSDLRSQAVSGMRLPTTSPFEVSLPDRSHVSFTLSVRQPLAQGASIGVAGGGTRTTRVLYKATNVWWLITDSKGIAVTFGIKIRDAVMDRLMKMGIDSRVISFASGLLIAAFIGGFLAYTRHRAAVDATDRAETAEDAAALAQAAREASLETELECLEERAELAAALGEVSAQREAATLRALELDLSRTVSLELGGLLLSTEDLLTFDGLFRDGVVSAVVGRIDSSSGDPTVCLEFDAALGSDIPRYVLLWNPEADLTCPDDYSAVDGGVEHIGRWGLSERLAREYGHGGDQGTGTRAGNIGEILGDPRREERWSAFTLTAAYRDILETVLRAKTGKRPPVMPSQAQLWALAFLDAYNRLPSPAQGVLDGTGSSCVEEVILDHLSDSPPAVPGESVLPDIVAMASEEESLVVARPTPQCPWPALAIQRGAESALLSAGLRFGRIGDRRSTVSDG